VEEPLERTQSPASIHEHGHVPPIFITGMRRCGATLLYLLLNQHPDIALLYESDLPVLWPMFRVPWERKTWVDKWEYWNASISRHDMDPARLASPVHSLAEAFELAGREHARRLGKKRWGCKSPSYFDRLEQLVVEFPHARFVVVWRDPEECCRSAMNAAATSEGSGMWFAKPGTNLQILLAAKALKKQVDALLTRGVPVHQIHYRDLVTETTKVMRGICEFLQVPFDPAVAVLGNADRSAVFKGAHHSLARGSSIVSSTGRHQALPSKLTRKIERYRTLWKAQNGDTWLLSRHFPEGSSAKPSLWERWTDRLLYVAFRIRDIAPKVCFSILPLSVWQTYRRLKYGDAQRFHRLITDKQTTLNDREDARHRPTSL
jgi:Sulfotransferase family